MIVSLARVTTMEHALTELVATIVFVHLVSLAHDAKVISMNVYRVHAQAKALWTVFNWSIITTVTANLATWDIIVKSR